MNTSLQNLDNQIINFIARITPGLSRLSLFIIYFWFGILKLLDTSPANPLVEQLQQKTLPFLTFEHFIIGFAIYEMVIGITFLIPGFERLALLLLVPHLISTSLPLVFLPAIAWQGFMTPTLEGQYIIKNLLILSLALYLVSRLKKPAAQNA